MKTTNTFIASTVILAGLAFLGAFQHEPARGQSGAAGSGGFSAGGSAPGAVGGGNSLLGGSGGMSSSRNMSALKLRRAFEQLRKAKDAAAKDEAKKVLSTLLQEQFDTDLKQREKEIVAIEARINELRNVLAKRRTARDKIIQLQIQVLVNEAEGLGFPKERSRSSLRGYFGPSAFGSGTAAGARSNDPFSR